MIATLKIKIRSLERTITRFKELTKESTSMYEKGLYKGNIQAMEHFLDDFKHYLTILEAREDGTHTTIRRGRERSEERKSI